MVKAIFAINLPFLSKARMTKRIDDVSTNMSCVRTSPVAPPSPIALANTENTITATQIKASNLRKVFAILCDLIVEVDPLFCTEVTQNQNVEEGPDKKIYTKGIDEQSCSNGSEKKDSANNR